MGNLQNKLLSMCEEYGMSPKIIKFYSDDFDTEIGQDLVRFLEHPTVARWLGQVNERAQAFMNLFTGDLLEDHYAFGEFSYLDNVEPFSEMYDRALSHLRVGASRTEHSSVILDQLSSDLEPYMADLKRLGIGCAIGGSVYFGDAVKESDADFTFYMVNATPEAVALCDRIRDDFSKARKNYDVAQYWDLTLVKSRLQNILSGQMSEDDFLLHEQTTRAPSGEVQRFIFSHCTDIGLLWPNSDVYEVDQAIAAELDSVRTMLVEAIDANPIYEAIFTNYLAFFIHSREQRELKLKKE
jgi:hypothetical protein